MSKRLKTLVVSAAVVVGCSASVYGQSADALIKKLVQKGILTEQEAKELKAEAETEPKTSKASPFVLPLGKESSLKLGGFIQGNGEFGDVSAFEGRLPGGPFEVNDRFRLRRARINVSGEFLEKFDFKLEGDFSQSDGTSGNRSSFSGTDIFLNWHQFPEANLKFGQYKAPFGLEQLTPDTALYTAERSLVTGALTPERQVGVQVWGKPLANLAPEHKELLSYALGVFNGNGRNFTVNDNNDFLYVGRLELVPWSGKLLQREAKLKVGANGLYSRDAANVNLSPTLNLRLQPDGSLQPFNTHSRDERRGWGADISFNLGPFDLIAEYLESRFQPRGTAVLTGPDSGLGTLGEFTANGYYVQASCFLPRKKFQVVAKWESFNPGQAAGDNLSSITGGLNYYIKGDSLKLMLEYLHTWSEYREERPGTGENEFDEALLRAQLMF